MRALPTGAWRRAATLVFGVTAVLAAFLFPVFLLKLSVLIVGGSAVVSVLLTLVLGPERARGAQIGLLVAGAALGLSLIAGEVVVRVAFADVTTTGNNRSYFARRWQASLPPPNALGFREDEVTPAPAEGIYRIAVIGDSFTWGQGIDREERMTERLERWLNERSPGRFEVLNFGRAGAETVDHLETLRNVVLPLRPDFVLMQWYTNDVEGRDKRGRPKPAGLVPSDAAESWLQLHSALYHIANEQWVRLQTGVGLVEGHDDYMNRRFGDPNSPDMVAARSALKEFIDIAQEARVGVGVAVFPAAVLAGSVADFPHGYLLDRVLEVCAEEGIGCVDLRHAYLRITDPEGFWASELDHHPGPRANEVAAEAVAAYFGDAWLSAARPGAAGTREPVR